MISPQSAVGKLRLQGALDCMIEQVRALDEMLAVIRNNVGVLSVRT